MKQYGVDREATLQSYEPFAQQPYYNLVIVILATLFAARLVESLLYRTSAHDPLTLAAIAFTLGLVAFLACLIPAQRATRVNPLDALRAE